MKTVAILVTFACVIAASQEASGSPLSTTGCDVSDAYKALQLLIKATGEYCTAIYAGFWTYNLEYAQCFTTDTTSTYSTLLLCLYNVTTDWVKDFSPATQTFIPEFIEYYNRIAQDLENCPAP